MVMRQTPKKVKSTQILKIPNCMTNLILIVDSRRSKLDTKNLDLRIPRPQKQMSIINLQLLRRFMFLLHIRKFKHTFHQSLRIKRQQLNIGHHKQLTELLHMLPQGIKHLQFNIIRGLQRTIMRQKYM